MIAIRNRLYSILLGGSLLPKCNLIFNWKPGYDEKVAGNTPKVLYPQGLIKDSDDHYHYDPTTTIYGENTVIDGYDIKDRQYTLAITSSTRFDIDYTGNDTFLGGKAIAPYCKVDFEQAEGFDYNTANGTDDKIDSGIYIDEISKIETYVKAGNLSSHPSFFGSYDSVGDDSRLCCGIYHSSTWYVGLGNSSYIGLSPNIDGWKKITIEIPVRGTPTVKFYIDDVLIDTITGSGTLGHFKLGIFGNLWDNDINTWDDLINGSMRYFKIWTDDTLVFELIPKEDGQMYDVVSGTDKNTLGTGLTFTSEATESTNILPFKRVNPDYNDLDNLTYEGFDPAHVYSWNATELMRGVEWIKSLQPDWHIFMKVRDEDKILQQIVAYKLPEIDYAQRVKVLKATKDKVTDVTDYALYINGNSAMLNQNGVPAEVGDTVSKIHSISNELIVSQTDETKQPTLQAGGSLLFDGVDDYYSFPDIFLDKNKTIEIIFNATFLKNYLILLGNEGDSEVYIQPLNNKIFFRFGTSYGVAFDAFNRYTTADKDVKITIKQDFATVECESVTQTKSCVRVDKYVNRIAYYAQGTFSNIKLNKLSVKIY